MFTKPKKPKTAELLKELRIMLGGSDWFISGSYANDKVKTPKDIDIFFYSKEGFDKANNLMESSITSSKTFESECAVTYQTLSVNLPIQLIRKSFGSPDDIFKTFDINVCKKAIRPGGELVVHKSANNPVEITKINTQTFDRYFRYLTRMGDKSLVEPYGKALLDRYIGDSTIITGYYSGKAKKGVTNRSLFAAACKYTALEDYALQLAKEHAPELLV